jgi:lysophospholipase L1-like esterase
MASSPTTVYFFAGDSLIEGRYGEECVERVIGALRQDQAGIESVNVGREGDTVMSLLDRIDEPLCQYQPHWVILAVGSNDVWVPWLSNHSYGWWLWSLYRRLRWGQKATTDLDQFAAAYRSLIDKAQTQAGAEVLVCTISPIGERLSSPVNQRVARLNGVIKHVAVDRRVLVADVWQAFVERLATLSSPSAYVAGEWLFVLLDRQRLRRGDADPEDISRRRRLSFTFDGIHLNGRGADLWAATVVKALSREQETLITPALSPDAAEHLSHGGRIPPIQSP